MPPSDPAAVPPPAWAVKMAVDYLVNHPCDAQDGISDPLARLLASVREGALREAARFTCDGTDGMNSEAILWRIGRDPNDPRSIDTCGEDNR